MSPSLIAAIVGGVVVLLIVLAVVMRGRGGPRMAVDEAAGGLKLPIGTTRVGKYKIDELLADGQFAVTYSGRGDDGTAVCIKLPSRASIEDADELKRFEREAQMLETIDHPNIIRKIADGRVVDQGRMVPYMILEPLRGMDFGAFLAEKAPLAVPDALRMLGQVASALDAVHDKQIVHRNLGPEALRVCEDGNVLLFNFGVARAATMQTITIRGQIVGTIDYIAPEQIAGKKVDARTDLYALGVLAYRLLTGKSPFVYANIAGLVKQKNELEGPHPAKANDKIPADLDRLVSQLLSADPNRRPGPASSLVKQFANLVA